MYSRLDEEELPNSPPRTRKGAPSTMSCVAAPCLRRCGSEDGCAPQISGQTAKKQPTAKTNRPRRLRVSRLNIRWRNLAIRVSDMIIDRLFRFALRRLDVTARERQKRRPVRAGGVTAAMLAPGQVAIYERGLHRRKFRRPEVLPQKLEYR